MAPTFEHDHVFETGYCKLCGCRESATQPIETLEGKIRSLVMAIRSAPELDIEEATQSLMALYIEYGDGCRIDELKSIRQLFNDDKPDFDHASYDWINITLDHRTQLLSKRLEGRR